MDFWSVWVKPWTFEQCSRRYIEGSYVSILELSKISGKNRVTLALRKKQENWDGQRRTYQEEIKQAIQEKLSERLSNEIADNLIEIAKANYEAHKLERDLVLFALRAKKAIADKCDLDEATEDEILEVILKLGAGDTNQWSLALSRATAGIAEATGLNSYINVNTALKRIENEGYLVLDPTQSEEQKQLPAANNSYTLEASDGADNDE